MNKQEWEGRIIDYIDGKLTEKERAEIEEELTGNASLRTLYEQLKEVIQVMDEVTPMQPSANMRISFENALQHEMNAQQKTKSIFFSPQIYRIAAGIVLVLVGIAIGYWINKNHLRDQEMAMLSRQVEENRNMMLAMIENEQSASQRMMGVSVAYELEKADDEIVQVLVKTMNEDANTNVRLAALEALSKFSHENKVRHALIASLTSQKDPMVQIALIQLMVSMKEKGIVKELEKMTRDANTMKAVKDEAYTGILKLS